MAFDVNTMVERVKEIRPKAVYVGYNSKDHSLLSEPSLTETGGLIEALAPMAEVRPRFLRKAPWERS